MKPPVEIVALLYLGLGAAWLTTFWFLGRAAAHAAFHARDRRALALAALFLGALLLRLALATWGPGDDQFRQRAPFLADFPFVDARDVNPHLGSAPVVLWRLLSTVVTVSDTTIVLVALLFGALAPVLLALTLEALGARRLTSLAAGVLLAVHAVPVRFSGDMSRMPHVVFLCVVALWALARHANTRRAGDLALFVASAWLCCRSRPEAGMVLPIAGLMVLAVRLDAWRRLRERWLQLELGALFVAGVLGVGNLLLAAHYEGAIGPHVLTIADQSAFLSPDRTPWLDPAYTSVVVIALTLLGAGWGLWRRDRIATWATIALLAASFGTHPAETAPLRLAYARYHGLPVLLACVLAGVGVLAAWTIGAERLRARLSPRALRTTAAVVGLVFVVTTAITLGRVTAPRTIDHEYRFLRDALRELPPCAVVYRPFGARQEWSGGFRAPDQLARHLEHTRWATWPPVDEDGAGDDAADDACAAFFYLSPACHVSEKYYLAWEEIRSRCDDALARTGDEPALVAEIPARPFGNEVFDQGRIPIGFYRVAFD